MLFDLYNTLVPGGTRSERDEVSRRMAEVLGVEPDRLADLVRRTFDSRTRGRLGDLTETVTWLAGELGAAPGQAAIQAAVELRLAMTRRLLEGTWALGVLTELRHAGLLLGVVSDCSAETPTTWSGTRLSGHFAAVSFSCLTGHRKPAPEAYLVAARELGVRPEECVFVGDGGSQELTGAAALGMTVHRYRRPGADPSDAVDEDDLWAGPTVSALEDVVASVLSWPAGGQPTPRPGGRSRDIS